MSILLVEQYLDFVLDLADYIYIMEKGEIVEKGAIDEIDKDNIKKKMAI